MDELTKYLDADGFMTPRILREFEADNRNDYTLPPSVSSVTTRPDGAVEGPAMPCNGV